MKISKMPLRTTIAQALQSPRTRWLFIASLVTLLLASRHTLPVRDPSPGYTLVVEVIRSSAAFYLAGMCVTFARMSVNNRVHAAAIGAINAMYAMIVLALVIKTIPASALDVTIGTLIAGISSGIGAFAAITFGRRLRRSR
jgi:hypothetical protein